jgi:hypothetical protein
LEHDSPADTVGAGGSLTGVTVIGKVTSAEVSCPSFAVPPSSLSTTVMLALPLTLAAGVKLSVPSEAIWGPAANSPGLVYRSL